MSKRDGLVARTQGLAEEIAAASDRPATFMEVCGTHAHQFARYGLSQMLPEQIELLSGPGCPVCVTSAGEVDATLELARVPGVVIATFGDMIRVPGSESTLAHERARGADIRVLFSPVEAVDLASELDREVVLIGIGFETTTPGVAVAMIEARKRGLTNLSLLAAHKRLIPALEALASAGEVSLQGLLAPGHVSTIIGAGAYRDFVAEYQMPCVIAGFEPDDMLCGVLALTRQLRDGRAEVENEYTGVVSEDGNRKAQAAIEEVFEPVDAQWRGLGVIPGGGLKLRESYAQFDALSRFQIDLPESREHPACRCGEVLRGAIRPRDCAVFGAGCTPEHPLGPCMVSSEGACAAVYRYEQ